MCSTAVSCEEMSEVKPSVCELQLFCEVTHLQIVFDCVSLGVFVCESQRFFFLSPQ